MYVPVLGWLQVAYMATCAWIVPISHGVHMDCAKWLPPRTSLRWLWLFGYPIGWLRIAFGSLRITSNHFWLLQLYSGHLGRLPLTLLFSWHLLSSKITMMTSHIKSLRPTTAMLALTQKTWIIDRSCLRVDYAEISLDDNG